MKRKLSIMLIALLSILMLSACGKDPKTIDYNGKSYDDLAVEAVTNAFFTQLVADTVNNQEITSADKETLLSYGFSEAQINSASAWMALEKKYGDCSQLDLEEQTQEALQNLIVSFNTDDIFTVTKAGNTLTGDLTLRFGQKDVIFELVYDYYDMAITGISVNPVQTMGEKMTSAGQNTVISLAIVFFVLILISLIIKGFVIFPMIEEKKKNKAKAKVDYQVKTAQSVESPVVSAPVVEENLMDDTELIAVIAAAIAAYEGTSTSDFVVRSINRR